MRMLTSDHSSVYVSDDWSQQDHIVVLNVLYTGMAELTRAEVTALRDHLTELLEETNDA